MQSTYTQAFVRPALYLTVNTKPVCFRKQILNFAGTYIKVKLGKALPRTGHEGPEGGADV